MRMAFKHTVFQLGIEYGGPPEWRPESCSFRQDPPESRRRLSNSIRSDWIEGTEEGEGGVGGDSNAALKWFLNSFVG